MQGHCCLVPSRVAHVLALSHRAHAGLQLWKRNLQLLVPFLIEPSLDLTDIKRTGRDDEGRETILVGAETQTSVLPEHGS